MKALRYLLIVSVLLVISTASIIAKNKNQRMPSKYEQTPSTLFEFQSTSAMKGSGSALPIAAQSGVVVGSSTPGDDTPAEGSGHPGRSRRATMDDDPFGGETIEDTGDPQQPGTPIGDGMWVMMLLAFGYCAYVARNRARAVRMRDDA